MRSIPQHCTPTTQKSSGIRVGPDLFRLVNIQGYGISSVGGWGGGGERTVS